MLRALGRLPRGSSELAMAASHEGVLGPAMTTLSSRSVSTLRSTDWSELATAPEVRLAHSAAAAGRRRCAAIAQKQVALCALDRDEVVPAGLVRSEPMPSRRARVGLLAADHLGGDRQEKSSSTTSAATRSPRRCGHPRTGRPALRIAPGRSTARSRDRGTRPEDLDPDVRRQLRRHGAGRSPDAVVAKVTGMEGSSTPRRPSRTSPLPVDDHGRRVRREAEVAPPSASAAHRRAGGARLSSPCC